MIRILTAEIDIVTKKFFGTGLKHSTSLKSINLSSIGVTEDDTQAVKAFASSLALSQTVVEVDFSANHIGMLTFSQTYSRI